MVSLMQSRAPLNNGVNYRAKAAAASNGIASFPLVNDETFN
jgi:hypothetical protein